MDALAFAGLLSALAIVLSILSWIGWRYFIAPMPVPDVPRLPEPEAPAPHTAPVAAPIAPAAPATAAAPALAAAPAVERPPLFRLPRFFNRTVLLALLVVGGVVGAVLALSDLIAPDPLEANEMERQAHIQATLNPERLVPPPPMPPALFIGTERPALESADRDWDKLNPRFTQSVLLVLSRLRERGYPFVLLEGYRSPERQDKLANMGTHVTNARAFQSKHQFGFAVDLSPMRDGKLVISERDPWAMEAYNALGEEAEKVGLTWGGRWSFKDFGHIETPESVASLAKQAAGK